MPVGQNLYFAPISVLAIVFLLKKLMNVPKIDLQLTLEKHRESGAPTSCMTKNLFNLTPQKLS